MKIDNRLKVIASYVSDNSYVIDVGCDHALIDIYLCLTKHNIKAIASDINSRPLLQAKKNISNYKLEDRITTIKSSGLNSLNELVDTIIISGMGAYTINDIINNKSYLLSNIKKIIICSNNHSELIRNNINKLNFKIINEQIVYDKGKYYQVIVYAPGKEKLNIKDINYGPFLRHNNDLVTKEYFLYEKSQLLNILKNIPKKYFLKRLFVLKKIRDLANIL